MTERLQRQRARERCGQNQLEKGNDELKKVEEYNDVFSSPEKGGKLLFPKNLKDDKRKIRWLQNQYNKVLENNSARTVKILHLEKYLLGLEDAIDYVQGRGDYLTLSNEARRIVMFLLSCRKAWREQEDTEMEIERKIDLVFKLLRTDLLPEFRIEPIIQFLDWKKPIEEITEIRPLTEREEKLLNDEAMTNVALMYSLGRTYEEIIRFRNLK